MQTYSYRDATDVRQTTADQLVVGHHIRVYTHAGYAYPQVTDVQREEPTKWFPNGQVVVSDSAAPGTVMIFHPDDVVFVR